MKDIKNIIKELEECRSYHESEYARIGRAIDTLKKCGEENTINSEQHIEPIIFNPEIEKRERRKLKEEADQERKDINKKGKSKYTPEIKKYIENNLHMNNEELADAVNKRFNIGTTKNGIGYYKCVNGLTNKREKKVGKEKREKAVTKCSEKGRPGTLWTEEVFDFVRDNLKYSNRELANKINKKFKMHTTEGSLGVQMSKEGIHRKGSEKRGMKKEAREPDMRRMNKGNKQNFKKIKPMSEREIKRELHEIGEDDPDDCGDDLPDEFAGDEESDE